ncbi:MAG: enoyl-CoA hydratase/isomerase family protein [Bacillota bacterium]|nr:enoyl-CoA hydratase/isomerase family protein [Bacillota bacterium]
MSTILYEKQDQIAIITMNRPEKRNAINVAMIGDICEALTKAAADPEVDLVIIAGAGEKSFTAGFDLKEAVEVDTDDPQQTREGALSESRLFQQILYFPKPTIAQVQGYCIGAGNWIAMACDMIVASDDATFGQPEILLGFSPEFPIEMWKMPYNKMNEWLFTGKYYTVQEMEQMGVVNQVVPFADLSQATLALAEQVLKVERGTMRYMKHTISQCFDLRGMRNTMNFAPEVFIQALLYRQKTLAEEFNANVKSVGLTGALKK